MQMIRFASECRKEDNGYQHFLLFPQCLKAFFIHVVKTCIVSYRVTINEAVIFLPHNPQLQMNMRKKALENTVRKAKILVTKIFYLFQQCFSTFSTSNFTFSVLLLLEE